MRSTRNGCVRLRTAAKPCVKTSMAEARSIGWEVPQPAKVQSRSKARCWIGGPRANQAGCNLDLSAAPFRATKGVDFSHAWSNPRRHLRLDLRALARGLLSREVAHQARARIRRRQARRDDRDQRHLLPHAAPAL